MVEGIFAVLSKASVGVASYANLIPKIGTSLFHRDHLVDALHKIIEATPDTHVLKIGRMTYRALARTVDIFWRCGAQEVCNTSHEKRPLEAGRLLLDCGAPPRTRHQM